MRSAFVCVCLSWSAELAFASAHSFATIDTLPVGPFTSVSNTDRKKALIVHGRRDLAGEPRPDRVHRDRTRACHLTHDVDVVDAAIDDGRSRLHQLLMNLPEGASRLLVEIHAHHKRLSQRPAYLDEARP